MKLFLPTFCLFLTAACLSLHAADVRGEDGALAAYWRLGIERSDGTVNLLCSTAPFVSFSSLTFICGPSDSRVAARIEGSPGELFGWRIATQDGFFWRTICETPYADTSRSLILCRR